jgi:hypothetical protein
MNLYSRCHALGHLVILRHTFHIIYYFHTQTGLSLKRRITPGYFTRENPANEGAATNSKISWDHPVRRHFSKGVISLSDDTCTETTDIKQDENVQVVQLVQLVQLVSTYLVARYRPVLTK